MSFIIAVSIFTSGCGKFPRNDKFISDSLPVIQTYECGSNFDSTANEVFKWAFTEQMYMRLCWETSNDGGRTWRTLEKATTPQKVSTGTFSFRVFRNKKATEGYLIIRTQMGGTNGTSEFTAPGDIVASINLERFTIAVRRDCPSELLTIQSASVSYRLKLEKLSSL